MAVELTEPETSPFATVEEAIEEIRAGRFVVVVDEVSDVFRRNAPGHFEKIGID